jgi:acetylornithine deacetylase
VVATIGADGAVVTEPTGLRVCAAHKGFAWIAIETQGRAAHGSKPDLGIDAIAHMGRVLADLEDLGQELARRRPHPLLGTGSLHASLIEGGQELSSYPATCRLQVERRTVPGETRETVLAEVTERLEGRARADQDFRAHAELFFWRDPFEVSTSEPIVGAVAGAGAEVLGAPPEVYGDTPWMDAALLSGAGIPTVVFGPGGTGAHATTEWVSISDVQTCAEILARAAFAFCTT